MSSGSGAPYYADAAAPPRLPNGGKRTAAAIVAVASLTIAAPLHANTPEDMDGLGARVNAMGGAGTAAAADFSAVYYSPANLSHCANDAFSLTARHTSYSLEFASQGERPVPPDDQTRTTVGLCAHGPFGLSLGLGFGSGLQQPMTLGQTTLSATPRYAAYGTEQQQLSIMIGGALRLTRHWSLGMTLSALAGSRMTISSDIPLLPGTTEVAAGIGWQVEPAFAPYFSARYDSGAASLAATYRSALFHHLHATATVNVDATVIDIPVSLLLQSVAWYSPRSLSVGATLREGPVLLAAQLDWFNWSAYPGPFITVSPASEGTLADVLSYPPQERLPLRDIIVSRAGLEYRASGDRLAWRVGASYRPTFVDAPIGRANLLDTGERSVSAGGGYTWGYDVSLAPRTRPDETQSADDDAPVLSVARPGADFVGARPLLGAPERRTPPPRKAPGVNASVDWFVRVRALRLRDIERRKLGTPVDRYRFGGSIFDVGLAVTIGWY